MSSLVTLKTKELWRGGGKHLPPVLHQPKKHGAYRVKEEPYRNPDTSQQPYKGPQFIKITKLTFH